MSKYSFLNVRQAAQDVGLTEGRIRQLLLAGELVGVKANERAWLIERGELARWKKSRKKFQTGVDRG